MLKEPSAILIESFALIATADEFILYVPPVILTSSFPVIPFCDDSIFNVPVPLNVISCFEKITAFRLLLSSFAKLPVTFKVLLPVDVTNTLSAVFTYITGIVSFVIERFSITIWTFSESGAST